MRQRWRGYTLLELCVVLVVLGVALVLLWRFGSLAGQRLEEQRAPRLLNEVSQAVVGFAAAQHRLPCPDTVGDGLEHCGGAAVGRLPVRTLGLARADLAAVRYGVYRGSANLDRALDRYLPLLTTTTVANNPATSYDYGTATATLTALGQVNGIDFCTALRQGGGSSGSGAALHIRTEGGAVLKNVAFALALPGLHDADGDGSPFDGANTVDNGFAAPAQPRSAGYDDVVHAADFGQVFDRLGCAGVLSAAGHSHFNAATAAALTHASFVDYKSQLQITAELAHANSLLAGAALTMATADVAMAAASILFATAEALLTAGAMTPVVVMGTAASVVAIAAEAAAIAGLVVAIEAENGAKQTVLDFQPLLDESAALEIAIRANALAADAAGLY